MKTRFLLLALLVLTITAGTFQSASALATWVEFTNPRISYLNDNIYRFRVDVNWGGDPFVDPDGGAVVDPILDRLWITNPLGMAVSWTGNHMGAYGYSYAGDWYGGIESPYLRGEFGLRGPEFGWDFMPSEPIQSSYMLNYTAFTAWLDYDYDAMKQVEGGNQSISGDMLVAVIPEPASMLLLGLGLAGVAMVRRRR